MPGSHHSNKPPDPLRRPGRDYLHVWLVAIALVVVITVLLTPVLGWPDNFFAGWDAALVVLLVYPWWVIVRSDAQHTRAHAAIEDPGKVVLFVITVVASIVSLFAAVLLLGAPESRLHVVLGGVAVVGAWLLVHTAFTFHYAHLYYREDQTPGGLEFPGGEEPDDLDFAYFAFTIGMTFQTSDIEVSERGLRRAVLRHAMLSFVFNTAILALAVSLLFGRLQ